MKNVLRAIARTLRAMLGKMSHLLRRLLGYPNPGPDVEELDVADVGLDAVTSADVRETYSATLARRIREAAAARLRGQDSEESFSAAEHFEKAWIARLPTSQLERLVTMSDAEIIGHVSGERVVPGILPMLRMPWSEDTYLPQAAMDPETDPKADCGLNFRKQRSQAAPQVVLPVTTNLDGLEPEMIEIGIEAAVRAWQEKYDREAAEEAAEADRDAA